jgi:thiamine-phosphate pyrophosphorylase
VTAGDRPAAPSAPAPRFDPASLRVIAVTDDLRDGTDGLVGRAAAAVRGGATMVQLRLKDAGGRSLVEVGRALVASLSVPVLVNDRVDVALACGAAGAHLGASDLPIADARRIVPPGFILGASVSAEADLANARPADYVGIGPVYPTSSKLDAGDALGEALFAELARRSGRPAVAIGGVSAAHLPALRRLGAAGVAVISAIFGSADPAAAAAALRSASGT